MLTRMRGRLTYANVMATIAVLFALGGTSVAAVTLKRNAVKGRNIATGAVGTRAVLDRSLLAQDFRPGQLAASLKGESGLRGPAGPAGTPGAAGRDGAALAARFAGGGIDIDGAAYYDLPMELRWTQPAGTLDELKGVMTVTFPPACLSGTVHLQVVRDGLEVSADATLPADLVGNGPPDAGDSPFMTRQGAVGTTSTDTTPLPIELPWTDSAGEHLVKLRVKETCGAGAPHVDDLRLWVARTTAG